MAKADTVRPYVMMGLQVGSKDRLETEDRVDLCYPKQDE